MNDNRKYVAELLGTFTLVFGGSLAILSTGTLQEPILVAVAFGFGLSLLAGLYAFAEISGGHYNPAVTLSMFLSGRLESRDLIAYWIAQFAGGVLASLAVLAAFSRDEVTAAAAGNGAIGLPPPLAIARTLIDTWLTGDQPSTTLPKVPGP